MTAALVALIMFVAVGCHQVKQAPIGTGVGAGIGLLAGAALSDSAVGGLLGALVGGAVGNVVAQAIDDDDRGELEQALETGEPVTIRDSDENLTLRLIPTDRVGSFAGYEGPCRSFVLDATARAGRDEGRGIACRVDGDWRIVAGSGAQLAQLRD